MGLFSSRHLPLFGTIRSQPFKEVLENQLPLGAQKAQPCISELYQGRAGGRVPEVPSADPIMHRHVALLDYQARSVNLLMSPCFGTETQVTRGLQQYYSGPPKAFHCGEPTPIRRREAV
jgi:hypothetical protein